MIQTKILIVDDETFARNQISEIVQKVLPDSLISEVSSLVEAKNVIAKEDFTIIFLDINLKGETGFDLVPSIPKQTNIIFITAMDKYAIRAFEINALDYILKPPTIERVTKAIDRIKGKHAYRKLTDPLTTEDRIFVKTGDEIKFIQVSDIKYIQADGVYTQLFTSKANPVLIRKPLSNWNKSLPSKDFIQIHRTTIINLNNVARIVSHSKGTFKIYMNGLDTPLPVSRSYSSRIKERLLV